MPTDSKKRLRDVYARIFGLDLTDQELDIAWQTALERRVTPMGDYMNIALTPRRVIALISLAVGRIGSIDHARFKKIREEIIPAMEFALFLKKNGSGEHLLLSTDAPDIALVSADAIRERKSPDSPQRLPALPLEITFVRANTLSDYPGSDVNERIVNAVATKKFNKTYGPNTILLVVLDLEEEFNIHRIHELIAQRRHYLHNIFIHSRLGETQCVTGLVHPSLNVQMYDQVKDIEPILY